LGVACLVVNPGQNTGQLNSMFVDPSAKRIGLKGKLLRRILRRASALGAVAFGAVALERYADPAAVPFYEHYGHEIIGQVPSRSIPGRFIPKMRASLLGLELPEVL